MTVERAVLTALPAGFVDDDHVRVTVFVTPRVKPTGGDVLVPDLRLFGSWPQVVARLGLGLESDAGAVTVVGLDPGSPAPNEALWDLLFARAGVEAHEFEDLSKLKVFTHPTSHLAARLPQLYAEVSRPTLPLEHTLATKHHRWERRARVSSIDPGELADMLDGLLKELEDSDEDEADGIAFNLGYRYYNRPEAFSTVDLGLPERPDYDFHQLCGALADYPVLLRHLGLAVDLMVKASSVRRARGMVRVTIAPDDGGLAELVDRDSLRPWTHYHRTKSLFVADHRDPSGEDPGVRDGMLDLRPMALTDVDVDGGAMKLTDALHAAARRRSVLASEGGSIASRTIEIDRSSYPAQQSAGITVIRRRRQGLLEASLARSAELEAAVQPAAADVPAELWADDVARGWRVDVLDESAAQPAWRSLCEREGTYLVETGAGLVPLTDAVRLDSPIGEVEGYVKSQSATTNGDAPVLLYAHEAVFGWHGWSLVARRPGKVATADGPRDPDTSPLERFPLSVSFAPVRGSLPALRFGHEYRFRARVADLAGNGHQLAGAVDGFESSPLTYRRWEPVLSPEVLPLHPYGEGESLLRVVLRSTREVPIDDYVALPRVVSLADHPASTPSGADWSYKPVASRHLAPPKESQLQAETHGAFDGAIGPAGDPSGFAALARREAATFYDVPGAVVVAQAAPTKVVPPVARRGDPLPVSHAYLTAPTAHVAAPYLPDHLARGVAIHGLPDRADSDPLIVWFDRGVPSDPGRELEWPDWRGVRIDVVEGPGSVDADHGEGVVTVPVEKGRWLDVRLSSVFRKEDLPLLAVWHAIEERADALGLSAGDKAKLLLAQRELALDGRLWTLTPWIDARLVHAVEMPLRDPELSVPGNRAARRAGETFASVAGHIAVDARSTERLDIDAKWTEPVDDVARPTPTLTEAEWRAGSGHVVDFAIREDEDDVRTGRDDIRGGHAARHEMGDTKHRVVDYTVTATTRFREYFPRAITDVRTLITTSSTLEAVDVPSSRRPDPPEVEYIVPIFDWDEARYGRRRVGRRTWPPAFRRTRRGGGLRIYLRRPWWSSGRGERLAVVVPNQRPPKLIDLSELLAAGRAFAHADAVANRTASALRERGIGGITDAMVRRAIEAAAVTGPMTHADAISTWAGALRESGADGVEQALLASVWSEVQPLVATEVGRGARAVLDALLAESQSAFVTRWGRDPAFVGGRPSISPKIEDFTDRDGWATGVELPDGGGNVAIATYEPSFDVERGLWYVDVHLAEHDHYLPFVRLALARYQACSVPGLELSRVVVADFAQLVPTREATLRDFGESGVDLTVKGRSGHGDVGETLLARIADDRRAMVDASVYVEAWVEERKTSSNNDLDWRASPSGRTRLALDYDAATSMATWVGQLELPEPTRGTEYRLAVEERQRLQTDQQVVDADDNTGNVGTLTRTGLFGRTRVPFGTRLLYAEQLPLVAAGGRLGPDAPER
jgi:hypothetical protein